MEPKDYLVALCRRWVWIAAAALVGASLGVLVAQLSVVTFRSATSMYVGVGDASTSSEVGAGSLIGERILPSLVSLARTDAVLEPVVEDLHLGGGPDDLAATLEVSVLEDTSVVEIVVFAPDPLQAQQTATSVAEHLEDATRELYRATGGLSPLEISMIEPASLPRFQVAPNKRMNAALGLVAGGAAMALLVGLRELFRPMVRGASGVSHVTSVPAVDVYAHDRGAYRRYETKRGRSLERLWWLLHESPTVGGGRRFAILGDRADDLARDLTMTGTRVLRGSRADREILAGQAALPGLVEEIEIHSVADLQQLRGEEARVDGLVVAADSGRTSVRALTSRLAAAQAQGIPLVGVVVDRVQPPQASLRLHIGGALRGATRIRALEAWARTRGRRDGVGRVTSARVVAVMALFLAGLAYPLYLGVDTALIATVALVPVWAGVVGQYRDARLLGALTALAVVSGLLLAWSESADHDITVGNSIRTALLLVAATGTVGLVLWARTILPLAAVGVAYGLGFLVTGLLRSPASANALKFELLLPIAIVVLSLLVPRRNVAPSLVALAALGVVGIASDARSIFSFCVVAAALVLWQARPDSDPRKSRLMGVFALAGAGTGIYFAVSELLVSGALGAELQARTTQQIAQSGSLLLGGRPEWTATWALMKEYPLGFGLGTVPNADEVLVAKTGFAVTHIPSGEHYIETYLFDGRFELHSILADMWALLGLPGLLLAVATTVVIVRCLADLLSWRAAPALSCVLAVSALWYMAFGPITSNLMDLAFALGVLMVPVGTHRLAHRLSAPAGGFARPAPGQPAEVGQ